MNSEQLVRKLNSVGKMAFVENYETFRRFAEGNITRESAIEILVSAGVSNESGAAIRLGNAYQIFSVNKQKEALEMVCESRRIPGRSVAEAERILQYLQGG